MMTEPVARGHLAVVGGTTEHTAFGLLGDVVARTNELWQAHWVDYPASFGFPAPYDESKEAGVDELIRLLVRLPADRPIGIVGYSQGAGVVEDAMRRLATSRDLHEVRCLMQIRYVGTVASPHRAGGDQVGDDPGGFGISGPLKPFQPMIATHRLAGVREAVILWEQFVLSGDVIAACPTNSLIRFVEPLVPAMSATNTLRWARDVQNKLTLTFVLAHFPELRDWRRLPALLVRIREAVDLVVAYQQTGVHMQYARIPIRGKTLPATQWIARELNEIGWQN